MNPYWTRTLEQMVTRDSTDTRFSAEMCGFCAVVTVRMMTLFVQDLVVAQVVRECWRRARRLRGHKDAVPGTRTGFTPSTMARNSLRGNASAVRRSATTRRPVRHVAIIVKTTQAEEWQPAAL